MVSPESKKLLEEFGKSPYAKALRDYLDNELDELDSVSNCTSWDDTLGRKKAVEVIRKLFSVIIGKEIGGNGKTKYW